MRLCVQGSTQCGGTHTVLAHALPHGCTQSTGAHMFATLLGSMAKALRGALKCLRHVRGAQHCFGRGTQRAVRRGLSDAPGDVAGGARGGMCRRTGRADRKSKYLSMPRGVQSASFGPDSFFLLLKVFFVQPTPAPAPPPAPPPADAAMLLEATVLTVASRAARCEADRVRR